MQINTVKRPTFDDVVRWVDAQQLELDFETAADLLCESCGFRYEGVTSLLKTLDSSHLDSNGNLIVIGNIGPKVYGSSKGKDNMQKYSVWDLPEEIRNRYLEPEYDEYIDDDDWRNIDDSEAYQ